MGGEKFVALKKFRIYKPVKVEKTTFNLAERLGVFQIAEAKKEKCEFPGCNFVALLMRHKKDPHLCPICKAIMEIRNRERLGLYVKKQM